MDRIASTARRVWCTFSSKESAEPSKMIWSKAARAAASAPARECVWSALRKIGVGRSARRARITPAISRTPMKPRSPSDTPTKTGARSSSTALTTPLRVASSDTLKWPIAMRRRSASASVSRRFMPGDSLRGSARPALSIELDEGGEPAVKRGSAPRHQARLQHFEDLLAGGAQPEGAFHVGHESRLLRAAEGEERDGHELAHLGGDVAAVAQALLVDPVVRLHEVGILPGRELPLGVDVATRFLHAGDQRVCALRPLVSVLFVCAMSAPPRADVYHTRREVAMILIACSSTTDASPWSTSMRPLMRAEGLAGSYLARAGLAARPRWPLIT